MVPSNTNLATTNWIAILTPIGAPIWNRVHTQINKDPEQEPSDADSGSDSATINRIAISALIGVPIRNWIITQIHKDSEQYNDNGTFRRQFGHQFGYNESDCDFDDSVAIYSNTNLR